MHLVETRAVASMSLSVPPFRLHWHFCTQHKGRKIKVRLQIDANHWAALCVYPLTSAKGIMQLAIDRGGGGEGREALCKYYVKN